MKIRGVTFEYLDPDKIGELKGERVGVIAQEVEKVFPDWVSSRDDGYKHVTFRGFEALTVEALRELRAEKDKQVSVLKKANEAMQVENEDLRARLEELETQVARILSAQQ